MKNSPFCTDERVGGKAMDEMLHDENTKLGQFVNNFEEAANPINKVVNSILAMSLSEARRKLCQGDHIACIRSCYSHHGIYDGDDGVYEYNEGVIRHVSLARFADGDGIHKINSKVCFSDEEIIRRAKSRIGEAEYNLFNNNCENYARWCRAGEQDLL